MTLAPRTLLYSAALRAVGLGNHVRAIKRVIEAAPSRICRVEHEARIRGGHDELRPRHPGDLHRVFGAYFKSAGSGTM